LGISTVRDKIVQTAATLRARADLRGGLLPDLVWIPTGRRAQDAIEEVRFFIHAPRGARRFPRALTVPRVTGRI
jgi:retron-type reverse transcriptase